MKNHLWRKQEFKIQNFVMEVACARIKMYKPRIKII